MEGIGVFIVVGIILLVVIALSARASAKKRDALGNLARVLGGTSTSNSAEGTFEGVPTRIEFVTRGSGSTSESWTYVHCQLPPGYPFTLHVAKHGWLDSNGSPRDGVADLQLGDEVFDKRYRVEGAPVKETLRLRPIIPDVVRQLQRPMAFAGYDLPAGVNLTPCIHLAHRRAETYPDPTRFRPERFLGAKMDPYTWLPFGGGIRRCLGMAFALYEMKIVLAVMGARARMDLAVPGRVREVRRTITIAPKGGTRVVLRQRASV